MTYCELKIHHKFKRDLPTVPTALISICNMGGQQKTKTSMISPVLFLPALSALSFE